MLPILTRYLSTHDYGLVATFQVLRTVGMIMVRMGTGDAVARAYYDRDKKGFDFYKYLFNTIIVVSGMFLFLFQGRYKAIIVDKDAYLIPLSRYVHLNPVKAGIAERPEEYKWSSYNGYIGKQKENNWIEYSWVLSKFAQNKKKAWQKYKEYTEEGLAVKIESPFKSLLGQVVLGGEKFRGKIKGYLQSRQISQEIIERKRFEKKALPEDIVEAVAKAFGVQAKDIKDMGKKRIYHAQWRYM